MNTIHNEEVIFNGPVRFNGEVNQLRLYESHYSIADSGALNNGSDCTEKIQGLIDSVSNKGGGTIIVPAGKRYMIDATYKRLYGTYGGLRMRSNVHLHFEPGSSFKAIPNDQPVSCILQVGESATGVNITGSGGFHLVGERNEHTVNMSVPFSPGEWGHLMVIWDSATNVIIDGISGKDAWGDFIEIKPGDPAISTSRPNNIWIHNYKSYNCRRQGISFTGCKDVYVFATRHDSTIGTAPSAGFDFEADNVNTPNENINIFGAHCLNNNGPAISFGGSGCKNITIYGSRFEAKSNTLSLSTETAPENVTFIGCNFRGPIQNPRNIRFRDCYVYSDNTWTSTSYAINADMDYPMYWEGGTIEAAGNLGTIYLNSSTTLKNRKEIHNARVIQNGNSIPDLSPASVVAGYVLLDNVKFQHAGANPATGYIFSKDLTNVILRNCYLDAIVGRGLGSGKFTYDPENCLVINEASGVFANSLSADRGNADVTLDTLSDCPIQQFNTNFTANRTVTGPASDRYKGQRYTIVSNNTAAFTLNVLGVKTIPASTKAFVDAVWDGAAWKLVRYGVL